MQTKKETLSKSYIEQTFIKQHNIFDYNFINLKHDLKTSSRVFLLYNLGNKRREVIPMSKQTLEYLKENCFN